MRCFLESRCIKMMSRCCDVNINNFIMLRFISLYILVLGLLSHIVAGFCVRNDLTDDSEFYVRQLSGFKKMTGFFSYVLGVACKVNNVIYFMVDVSVSNI